MTTPDVQSLSNTDLDNAWYASSAVGDQATATFYADEIIRRMSGWYYSPGYGGYVYGPLENLASIPFPHYETATNTTTAAADSIAQSAGNVASSVGSALKWTGGGLLVFAGLAVLVFVAVKAKK